MQRLEIRNAAGGMHYEIGSHCLGGAVGRCMDKVAIGGLLDSLHGWAGPYVNPEFMKFINNPPDQIRIESRQHATCVLQHRGSAARAWREGAAVRAYVH